MALTDKQINFVNEYMKDMNATAAYRRAGYTAEGNAAEAAASRLLRNVKVQEEIEKRQKKLSDKAEISAEWVIRQLMENHKLARDLGELAPSNKALELLGKHLGIFTDKLDVSGTLNVEKVLEQL